MTHVWKTDTLAQRLRALADELESAQRYGLTLPTLVLVDSRATLGGLDRSSFDAWVDYTDARVSVIDNDRVRVQYAAADVNGLPVDFNIGFDPSEVAA